jgi:hypothetical protein
VEKQDHPIKGQDQIEYGNNVVIHLHVPNKNLYGDGKNQGHEKVPWNVNENKILRFKLSSGLMCKGKETCMNEY